MPADKLVQKKAKVVFGMRKKLSILVCAVLLFTMLLPVCALANPASMYVYTSNGKALHMRKTMVTGANNVVADIPYGAVVDVLSVVNATWAKCMYNNKTGYCMRRYLVADQPAAHQKSQPDTPAKTVALTNSMFSGMAACYYTATVRPTHPTGFVNLRWAPSTSAKIHDKYFADAQLVVMAQNKDWCQVLDQENNVMGFMMRSFLVTE